MRRPWGLFICECEIKKLYVFAKGGVCYHILFYVVRQLLYRLVYTWTRANNVVWSITLGHAYNYDCNERANLKLRNCMFSQKGGVCYHRLFYVVRQLLYRLMYTWTRKNNVVHSITLGHAYHYNFGFFKS